MVLAASRPMVRQVVTPSGWRPSPALEPYVSAFAAYDFTPGPSGHRGLPSTSLVVVLALEQPMEISSLDAPGAAAVHLTSASGLHARPVLVGGPRRQCGIWLSLTPAGSRSLLGVPAATLAGQIVDLPTVAPHLAELPERLAELGSDLQRLQVTEEVLLRALARGSGGAVRPDVAAAMPGLTGQVTVEGVARRLGWSRRHLSTAFRNELGVTPKQYHRIARFESSKVQLTRSPGAGRRPPLAVVAAGSGYADQAHLSREWKALAGCSPTAWLRAEHPRA